jgi:phosphatidylglycerol---prolipoprotein diacylglyceryl transferase
VILAAPIKFGIDPLAWEIVPRVNIGGLAISPHGVGIAVGFLIGAQLMVRRSRRLGGPDEQEIWNTLFWVLIGAMVGARVAYVIGHFSEVTDGGSDILGMFKVWEGGISLLGGITGGVLGALPYIHRHRLGFWRMADLAAPGLALGIAIGRIGDLMIGDHIGKPTSFFLGWRCLGESGAAPQSAEVYRAALERGSPPSLGCYDIVLHQTAIYDFISSWVLFGVLIWLGRKALRVGTLALIFPIWYGAMRLITDFLRVDKRYFGLTGSQVTALTVMLIALYLLARYRGAPPQFAEPPPPPPEASTTESDESGEEPAPSGQGEREA